MGFELAQKELVVASGIMYDDCTPEMNGNKTFQNNKKGFESLLSWVNKRTDATIPVRYVMEATGVYHEKFAYFLKEKGLEVSIVLPNKISSYMRTLEIKTITDKTASEAITLFGLERKLDQWQKPKTIFKQMKQLTRERDQIIEERTSVKNKLHAEKVEAEPNARSVERMKKRIQFLNKQEAEIKKELTSLINHDEETKKNVSIISSLTGVGVLTTAIVLGETNGFELVRNKRQLTSYAGFDIKEKLSGTSVKGKPRISKKGNKHLRKAMHLPALSAIRSDERFKDIFVRIVSKHGIKMKAAVAVQRKLLEMMYVLFKTQTMYNKCYLKEGEPNKVKQQHVTA